VKRVLFFSIAALFIIGCSGKQGPENQGPPGGEESGKAKAVGKVERVSLDELAGWRFLGLGEVRVDETEKAVFMSEAEDSKGVTLVSPESYGENVSVSFRVKPLTFHSVNVVILSASDSEKGSDFEIPPDYDGGFGFWTQGNVRNYIFAFHNAAHDRLPFIVRNPGMELLAEAEKHVTDENWHDVRVSRAGGTLRLEIDGKVVAEGKDPEGGLPGGKIGFRLRGTPGNPASALFKDVVVAEK